MKNYRTIPLLLSLVILASPAFGQARDEQTPYTREQKVVFDFFLDDPAKTASALYWMRPWLNPLLDDP